MDCTVNDELVITADDWAADAAADELVITADERAADATADELVISANERAAAVATDCRCSCQVQPPKSWLLLLTFGLLLRPPTR